MVNNMVRKFAVVTTFNQSGYSRYGSKMIDTFLATWPQEVDLYVYAEDCVVLQLDPRLHVIDLNSASPDLVAFKKQWDQVPKAIGQVPQGPVDAKGKQHGIGFKWDAVRFSHKVYAIFHCASTSPADWLLWMDGDTVCHSTIGLDQLDKLCPQDRDLCFLGRKQKYSECGLYAMNLTSAAVQDWLADFQQHYNNAEQGIFKLDEWHDSFVFDAVRQRHQLHELDWSGHLITGEGHPLINSAWGAYLDHLKGDRKSAGKSKPKDLKVTRTEAYWQ